MTEPETRQLIALLCEAYPNTAIGPGTVNVYVMMLADLEFGDAQAAVRTLLAESKFFPSIAEIRQAVVERRVDLPAPGEAWGEVMRQIRNVGMYGRPQWSSPAIQQAVRAIGWEIICQCELDDLNTLRAQFQRIYEAYRARAVKDENLSGLELPEPSRPALPNGHAGFRSIGDLVPFKRPGGE